jgi:hypothetical protein
VRNAVELQNLQPSVIDLHDRRNGVGPAAALDGEENLMSGLVDHHVIDDDVVVGGAQEAGELHIEAADQIDAFEVVEVAELHLCLRRQVLFPEREGVNRGAGDVADEEDVVGPEGKHAGRLERSGRAHRR